MGEHGMRYAGHEARRRPRHVLCLSVLSLVAVSFATAAGTKEPTPAASAEAPASPVLTVEQVQDLLRQAQEAEGLDAAVQTGLVDLYTSAIDQLDLARDFARKASEYGRAQAEAPDLLAQLESALAQSLPEPQITIPENATVADLEQKMAQADASLALSRASLADLEKEPSRRTSRRKEVPDLLVAANQRLSEAQTQLDAPAEPGEAPETTQARRTMTAARVLALQAEVDAYQKELSSYDARAKLLTLRQDESIRQVAQDEKVLKKWRDAVAARREQETKQAVQEAQEGLDAAHQLSPLVRDYAEELAARNEALVMQRTGPEGLVKSIEKATAEQEQLQEALIKIESDFEDVRERVDAAGLNNAIGLLLRNSRRDLPDVRTHRRNVRGRGELIATTEYALFPIQDERAALADVDGIVSKKIAGVAAGLTEAEREDLARPLRELLLAQRSYLVSLQTDYNTYLDALLRIQVNEQQLIDRTNEFAAFIDERVLWVRSGNPLHWMDFRDSWASLMWLLQGEPWLKAALSLESDLLDHVALYGFVFVVMAAFVASRRKLVQKLGETGKEAQKRTSTLFRYTVEGFAATVVLSLAGSVSLAFVAWRLNTARAGGDFERGLAAGVAAMAVVLLTFEVPRQIIRKDGLAEAHFDWPTTPLAAIRRLVPWLLLVGMGPVFVITLLENAGDELKIESLGRLSFIAAMLSFAVFAHLLLSPAKGPIAEAVFQARGRRGGRLFDLGHLAAVGIPITLAVMAWSGYFYTALRLSWRFHSTWFFGLVLLVIRGLVMRWLLVVRRRLAREQARKRREAIKAQSSGESGAEEASEPELDLGEVDTQTQSLLRSGLFFSLLIGVWLIWADVLPALGILRRVELWPNAGLVTAFAHVAPGASSGTPLTGVAPITLADLLLAVLVAAMTIVVVRNLPGLLEIAVLQRLPFASGERYAITTVLRYVLIITGLTLAFSAIGIGWGKVQWLVAAMGVGLGFGLQEIFANFVSGIIILFERPIRLGDTVTIGGISGTVSQIRIRATRITDWDRKELIVPNKEFVTGQLINWTLSDAILRVIVPVGIAYGSDTEKAASILESLARKHPLVLKDPAPMVLFTSFGSSSLDFELRVFCPGVDCLLQVKHELHMAIDKAFREAGIEIAFPQQDIHVRSIQAPLPLIDQRQTEPE